MASQPYDPAFPSKIENIGAKPFKGFNGEEIHPATFSAYPGMSLRDYFAAKALQGFLSNPGCQGSEQDYAELAYDHADAMIAQRNK